MGQTRLHIKRSVSLDGQTQPSAVRPERMIMLVFQYGSNCSDREINGNGRLRGDARFIDIAETVEDFELAFDVWSTRRSCDAADILRRPGNTVWGVLYEVPDFLIGRNTAGARGRKSLDQIEGEGTNYKRQIIDVQTPDGRIISALTYTVLDPKPGLKTNLDYVRHIVSGLREHGVPRIAPNYIDKVKRIAAEHNPSIAADIAGL
jgi:hypothetical protein